MSERNDVTVGVQRADEEVELTAEDLRALSSTSSSNLRRDPIAVSASSKANVPEQSDPSGTGAISRVGLSFGVALVVIAAAGWLQQSFMKTSTGELSTATVAQSAVDLQWATPKRENDSVRFANPFDATEVFEFSAGTTEVEAREAIAGFLMERAMNRQARLEGKPKRER